MKPLACLALLLTLLVGCSPVAVSQPPVATALPPATTTPLPTKVPAPTFTPLPTATPTATPSPTAMPSPTATPTPIVLSYVFPVEAAWLEYGEYHHTYPATDIFCPTGSRFVAPTSGVIDFVSYEDRWNPAADDPAIRGGISVAMLGDDGVRYYGSHLSSIAEGIAVGERVHSGQLLGLTGNSGNARSTPPHVHFGISRPTTPDDWQVRRGEISPYPYLRAWQRGENLTPALP
ncbi:MAG: M23 family peptidase [Candidatus Viridilinea halotolerans]|uniref:M23 family peptidase n=1 Tax=Candidatus Viridilinea halotolerans TaxID=2491704 RepID=A0A426U437_9CHLR|nr:MAG: M23 family peptidase [Candidatus Viridilinea halotolerans]